MLEKVKKVKDNLSPIQKILTDITSGNLCQQLETIESLLGLI